MPPGCPGGKEEEFWSGEESPQATSRWTSGCSVGQPFAPDNYIFGAQRRTV